MRQRKGIIAVATALALAASIGLWTLASPGVAAPPTTITVVEHATTDTVIDSDGDGADSTGDLLTFHNKVYDETNDHRVGRDMGDCIRVDVRRGTWECRWTTFLADGQITIEGPFSDTGDTVMAITGGTGAYSNAQGSMQLSARAGGTEFEFAFELS